MQMRKEDSRRSQGPRRMWFVLVAAALAVAACGGTSSSSGNGQATSGKLCEVKAPSKQTSVNVLAFSAPAIDPFTDSMVKGCSGVSNLSISHAPVDFTGQLQKADLALSSGGKSPYDIIEAYNGSLIEYASKGWILPLDSYISKYKTQYNLGDIPDSAWQGLSYNGHVYGLPNQQNTQILIYRKDLFDKLGLKPPTTADELINVAQKIKNANEVKYPVAMVWGANDALADGFHNWLMANGGKWFDSNGRPAFNSPAGQKALDYMKKLLPYMPPNSLTFANGDVMALMQQGLLGMTLIWASRAAPINDPNQSKVAGKVGFAPAPKGTPGSPPASEVSQDGYVIAKNAAADPDLLFQIIASTTVNSETQRKAAPYAIPARQSVLNDKSAQQPQWPAAKSNIDGGAQTLPRVPYMEPLTKSIVNASLDKALTGGLSTQDALTQASTNLQAVLVEKGYLK